MNRYAPPTLNPVLLTGSLNPDSYRLDNGIEVYELSGGSADVIKIDILLAAGSRYQPTPLCASAANRLLTEGTESFSSSQISERVDYHGAFLQGNSDKDHASLTLLVPRRHLEALLPLFAEVMVSPRFPSDELDIFRDKRKQRFLIEQTKVKVLAQAVFNQAIFGSHHPYGHRLQLSDFDHLSREQLTAFHKQHYLKGGWKIVVSGTTHPSDRRLLNHYLGQIRFDAAPFQEKRLPDLPESASSRFALRDDAVQSALRLGITMPVRNHPDYVGLTVLNTLLGGYFGSRLMQNLREEKGFTYGIHSVLIPLVKASFLVIVSEVGSDVTLPALQEIYHEVTRLSEEEAGEEELNLVKSQMVGEMIRLLDGPFAKADYLASLLDHNLLPSSIESEVAEIMAITPTRIMELANRYLPLSGLTRVVSGPSVANPGFPVVLASAGD